MIHISEVTWVQLFLIEVGVVLQLIAAGAFARGSFHYRRLAHPKGEEAVADKQIVLASPVSEPATPFHAVPMADKNEAENVPTGMRTGDLTRTAKVKFVQKFKFLNGSH